MSEKDKSEGFRQPVTSGSFWEQGERMVSPERVAEVFQNIRQEKYLIHMIPNTVSAALCADGISALGARPLMAVAPEEMEEIAAQADGCVVNLGQLNQEKLRAAGLVMEYAARKGKPLVLDPVGCGASSFRQQAVQGLLQIPWKGIIKGNRSEIYSIQQRKLTREGIDSLENRSLTEQVRSDSVYLVTGEPDCILWEGGRLEISHERVLRQNMVGSGCLAGAVAGACSSAVHRLYQEEQSFRLLPEMVLAALSASLGMAFVLEYASQEKGYGAAKSSLLDGLCMLSEKCFLDWLKVKSEGSGEWI